MNLISQINLVKFDAEHYLFIRNNGYEGFRVAFFPLFPLIWKLLNLSTFEVCIFNIILFICSFLLLIKFFNLFFLEILTYLSIPSFLFFFFPFSESIFFFFATLLLIGLKLDKKVLIYCGILFCSIARPSFTIFLPALFLMEIIFEKKIRDIVKNLLIYFSFSILGLFIVAFLQFKDTGEWFKFFEAQKLWGNYLQVPSFPLRSWSTGIITRLDAFALVIGLISGFIFFKILIKFKTITLPKEVIFSLLYLFGITFSVLIFRGGSLFSLNRFVFATPFIIVVMNAYFNAKIKFTFKNILFFLLLLNIFFLLFASFEHIQTILKFFSLSLYILLLFSLKFEKNNYQLLFFVILILLNFVFQEFFIIRYLLGGWIA